MTATHLKPLNIEIVKQPSLTQTLCHMLGVMRGVNKEIWNTLTFLWDLVIPNKTSIILYTTNLFFQQPPFYCAKSVQW